MKPPDSVATSSIAGFLSWIDPFLEDYHHRLVTIARPLEGIDAESAARELLDLMAPKLLSAIQRTLILELRIAGLKGELKGDDPNQRFQDFVDRLQEPRFRLNLQGEYPVLGCLCRDYLDTWLESSTEFLGRLSLDRSLLGERWASGELGEVKRIEGSHGDSHRGGRKVLFVDFTGGLRVVYKPRSLGLDAHFAEFLRWLKVRGLPWELKTARVIDRGDYGWCEHIAYRDCQDRGQIERFFERQGALLAIAYALSATDLHFENLIACGEFPVPVDLETLFHPRLRQTPDGSAVEETLRRLRDSVLAVGLLPTPVATPQADAVDVSALGAKENQLSPFEVLVLREGGTDGLHMARDYCRYGRLLNQPRLANTPAEMADYRENLQKGFGITYDLLWKERDALLASDGPLSSFRGDEVRVVPRFSHLYYSLLTESWHPHVLQNATDREKLFDLLERPLTEEPWLAPFIPSERQQLLTGDIPIFTSVVDSKDVIGGDGASLPACLDESGWEVAAARLNRMGAEDRKLQSWLVRSSIASLASPGEWKAGRNEERLPPPHNGLASVEKTLLALGDRLVETTIRKGDGASWLSLLIEANAQDPRRGRYRIGPVGEDLYQGSAGIILFLAYLAKFSGNRGYEELAQAAARTLRGESAQLGAFTGSAGLIYLFSHLDALWPESDAAGRADDELAHFERLLDATATPPLDVISGISGAIPCLLAFHKVRPGSRALELSIRCGEKLLEAAEPRQSGLAWQALPAQRGFSHGAAGIAWALSELAVAGEEPRFSAAAREALRWERKLLEEKWTDHDEPGETGQSTWCHGPSGIALARLATYRNLPDPEILFDIERALTAMEQTPSLRNHSLCHGGLGNLEPWRLAEGVHPTAGSNYEKQRARISGAILNEGWRCALPYQVDSPGLMVGLSGIGLALMRHHLPMPIPSVLLLEIHPTELVRKIGSR